MLFGEARREVTPFFVFFEKKRIKTKKIIGVFFGKTLPIRQRLIFPGDMETALPVSEDRLLPFKRKRNDLSSLVLNMHNNGLGLSC